MRREVLTRYLTKGLKTDLDVALFLAAMNQPLVGTQRLCDNKDHTPVFRALADVLLDITRYGVIWGSRSGSKTYLFGGLDTYYKSVTKKRYETKVLGGSEGQALLTYEALKEFSDICDPDNQYVKRLMMQKGEFKDGSKVSILTASSKSVRGPHPQCLKLDEVDEIDSKVYEDALSQPQSKHGHGASLLMFSTNHNINGQMDVAIARARERGHPVYRYCVWETVESCRDYTCSTCDLAPYCPGEQIKGADGYYKIEDLIEKMHMLSYGMFSRDWLCIKVGMGDAVYDQEWSDKPYPDGHLVSMILRNEPVVLSIDFGGVDPFSLGVWQKAPDAPEFDAGQWIRIAELYMTSSEVSTTNPQVIARAKLAPWWKWIREVVPDNSRPDLIQEWRKALPHAKFTVMEKKTIDEGIEQSKNALKPILGRPKILVNAICTNFRREIQTYVVKNDKPVDKNNHTMDEFRYFVLAKIRRVLTSYVGQSEKSVMPR